MGEMFFAGKDTEARMKDINLAYRFIAPLLKLNDPVKQELKTKPQDSPPEIRSQNAKKSGWDSFITKCEEFLAQFFIKEQAEALKKQNQKSSPEQGPETHKDRFRDVLEKVYAMPFDFEKMKTRITKKKLPSKIRSFNDYQRYQELKQKMKSGRSREKFNMSIGRVTKIEPVSRVGPVKRD